METFLQALRSLGPLRLAVMGAVILGLIGFFIFLTTRLTTPQMELLFGELDSSDSARIVGQLESSNTVYELRSNGSQIFVPSDKVAQLRLTMAEQGLSGGSIGYEIFDDADALGTTNFLQNISLIRALEGELVRSIKTIESVRAARVHLVLPRRELFSREKQQPRASILVKMRGATRLSSEQVSAIQHLVAAAVPGLIPSRISIVDDKGSLLARGFEDKDSPTAMAAKSEERRRVFENRLARTIEALLEKTVGFGKVRAEVTADMDFDLISTNEEMFNPDGQVVRSTQSVEEQSQSRDAEANQPVSVATNLPDANLGGGEGGASSSASENRTEETVNYEISKKIISHVRDAGIVKRLSVAVLVDGIRSTNEDGEKTYRERSEEEMQLFATLVGSAIGIDRDRGDSMEVINLRFEAPDLEIDEALELFFGLDKNDMLRMAEILVLSIVAILVILLVVRPLVSRAFEAIPSGIGALGAEARLLAEGAAPALAAPGAPGEMPEAEMEKFEEMIDIERIEGRVKASSVKRVGEIVEKHPVEALAIIRTWMYQES